METHVTKGDAARAALTAAGFTGKQVTVLQERCTYSTALRFTVRDPSVALDRAREVAETFESIRRCEVSGEILSGGNTFVHVVHSESARAALAAPLVVAVTDACARSAAEPGPTIFRVEGTAWGVGRERAGQWARLWDLDEHRRGVEFPDDDHGRSFAAYFVASAALDARWRAEKSGSSADCSGGSRGEGGTVTP